VKGHHAVSEPWTGPSTTLRCPYCGVEETSAWEISCTADSTTCASCGQEYELEDELVRWWRTRRKSTPPLAKCVSQGLPPGILASPRKVTDALPNEKDKP
jgi:hypothetical protein